MNDERIRFLLAGAWNTLFGLLAFAGVHAATSERLAPWAQLVIAYSLALPQSFWVQKSFVFLAAGDARRQWRRFAMSSTVIFAVNLALVPALLAVTPWHPVAVQSGYVAASTLASYLVHRHYSFARAAP